jgi:hypothetical protein
MTDIYANQTLADTAGTAIRAASAFRFYAADHLFAALKDRRGRGSLRSIRQSTDWRHRAIAALLCPQSATAAVGVAPPFGSRNS